MPDNLQKVLQDYVQSVGLKTTKQRELIAKVFFAKNAHLRAEEVLDDVRKQDPKISLATVYRTLKLLQACGLAKSHHFGDGHARFEPMADKNAHHDHFICTTCGKITEFYNEQIEQLQNDVANFYDFQVNYHRMELYGFCSDCKKLKI